MKVLITGASGFIGQKLLQAVCEKYGKDNVMALSSQAIADCETIVYDKSTFSVGLADQSKVNTVEVLIHAGAYTPKSGADVNNIEGCNGNIAFTSKLLNLPFESLRKIIYLSTLDVYENAELTTEKTPTIPQSLYGISKLYCEYLVSIFAEKTQTSCQILRVGHVYGPGEEKYAKLLPNAIKNIIAGKSVELWGDGADLRSFIYIDDVVAAILAAITLTDTVGVINVVGSRPISIRELLETIIRISGKQVALEQRVYNGPKRDCVFDNTKCRENLLPQEMDLLAGLQLEYNYLESLL